MLAQVGRLDPQTLLLVPIKRLHPLHTVPLLTLCSHVFLGLPLPLHPWNSSLRHFDAKSSTSFLSTCPYQRNLPFRTTSPHVHTNVTYLSELHYYPQATKQLMTRLVLPQRNSTHWPHHNSFSSLQSIHILHPHYTHRLSHCRTPIHFLHRQWYF